jgi:RNA polymerase sigma-54 factor
MTIDAQLLGKIEFARVLELPLRNFHRMVERTEALIPDVGLDAFVTVAHLPHGQLTVMPEDGVLHLPIEPLGQVSVAGGRPELLYYRESYLREYRFDEEGVRNLMSRPDFSPGQARVLHKLRLVNSRNRLTHALVQSMLEAQSAWLSSGEPLTLRVFTQTVASARLRSDPALMVIADEGRISRLARGLSVMLPNGQVIPLVELFVKPRQIHRSLVQRLVMEEKNWMLEDELHEPLTDSAIAEILNREYGAHLSRRTVVNIRQELAIPDRRVRCERMRYLAATKGFSALMPLTSHTVRNAVPAQPGVYEIRTMCSGPSWNHLAGWIGRGIALGQPGVIYIGSSADLRKRLHDHLRGNSDNRLLHDHIANSVVRIRFCRMDGAWRLAERELYQVFCQTFGAPPPCNRMSP